MRTIALFGGTFDPPHSDHFRILHHLTHDRIKVDGQEMHFSEVWVVPVSEHAFEDKSPLPYQQRKPMIEEMKRKVGSRMIFNSHVKIVLQTERYTADFLERLHKENADTRFVLVVGGDVLHDTSKWHRWEDITKMSTVLPFVRKGVEVPESWDGLDPVKFDSKGVSSTEVRAKLAKADHRYLVGGSFSRDRYPGMISEEVFKHIQREGLYGYEYKSTLAREVSVVTLRQKVSDLRDMNRGEPLAYNGYYKKMICVCEDPDAEESTVLVKLLRDTGLDAQLLTERVSWEQRRTNAYEKGIEEEWLAKYPEPKPQGPGFVILVEGVTYDTVPSLGSHLGSAHGLHFFEYGAPGGLGGLFGGLFGL